jgi:small-conductance mechanosensitive channel
MNGDDNMDKIVQDHEQRLIQNENEIKELKANQTEFTKQIEDLKRNQEQTQNSMLKLENTVLKANGEQKELLTKLVDHTLLANKKEKEREYDLKKINITNKWQFALTAISGGGVLYLIVEILIK